MDPKRALVVSGAGGLAGIVAQYLFVPERAGVNVVVTTAAVLLLARWALDERGRPRTSQLLSAALALAFAALVAIRTDVAVVWFDIIATLVCGTAFFLVAAGVSLMSPFLALTRRSIALAGATLIDGPAAWIEAAPEAQSAVRRAAPASGYATGLLLALPLVVVFSALFSAADAVFERSVRDLLDLQWLRDVLRDLPARVLVAMTVAWAATGVYAYVAIRRSQRGSTDDTSVPRLIAPEAVLVALVAIDLLFAAFVTVQAAYLFGGRDTLDAAGVTYSAYGRRGFFELVAVSALVGAVLFVFDVTLRGHRRSYAVAALVLIALTGAVLASAAYRMSLYQLAYGWTELRLYTFAGMAFLGAALAVFAWAVLRRRMEYVLVPLAVIAAAVALAVNALAPSDYVARRNIERVLDPGSLPADASRDLDVAYLVSLGDGAVPALSELAPRLPEPQRSRLLEAMRVSALPRSDFGWQSWNLDRERARSLAVRASGTGAFAR